MAFLKQMIKKYIIPIVLWVNDTINSLLKLMMRESYKWRSYIYMEGGTARPSNDHDISLYYRWQLDGCDFWNKVAAFSNWAISMFDKNVILELGCANGWYLREFYFKYTDLQYVGYDLSSYTIGEAKRKLKQKERLIGRKINASFKVKNILSDEYIYEIDATCVFWYASMCMFEKGDRSIIIRNIAKSLKKNKGIFCGSADVEIKGRQQWEQYIGLYHSDEELYEELKRFFKNVYISPRKETSDLIMFMASDGELPFYNKTVV